MVLRAQKRAGERKKKRKAGTSAGFVEFASLKGRTAT